MGHLLYILLALGTLLLPEVVEVQTDPWYVWGVLGLLPLPHLVAALVRALALRGRFRLGQALEHLLNLTPVLVQALAVVSLGWLAALESVEVLRPDPNGWPGPSLLVALAPFVVASLLAIDARAMLSSASREERGRARAFQLRLFLSGLLPFVLYLTLSGLIGSNAALRVHLEEVALLSAASTVLLLAVFVLLLPRLLTLAWDTTSLAPSPLRDLLDGLATRAGFRCRDILVWRTGAQMANATIIGFTPRSRVVLLSDVLLASLRPLEVAAVYGHEMGHALRRHALIFACYALGVLLAAYLVANSVAADDPALAGTIVLVALAVWALSFSFLSRRFELEADLESMRLLGTSLPLVGALQKVTGAHAFEKASWRHFSCAQRVRFLMAVEDEPLVGEVLRARLRRWSRVGLVLFCVVLGLQVRALASSWSEDGLVVDLRLGRYPEAADALARLEARGEVLERETLQPLIALAASLPAEARDPEALARRALAAFRGGDDERALRLAELAWLRGAFELGRVLDALDARAEGARDEEAEADVPDPWRAAFAERRGR